MRRVEQPVESRPLNPRPIVAPRPDGPVQPGPVPSFSVIIPAYQAEEFVGDAVDSALEQTVPPLEVIVCDDGSTDDIEGALEPYVDRIVFLRREHRGAGAAKSAAAEAAQGEFVAILDADNRLFPEWVEAVGALASARPDLDILTTDGHIELDGEVLRHVYDETWPFEVDHQRREILERNFVQPQTAVRRKRLMDVGGFDETSRASEDWDCTLRLILSGSRAGMVDDPLSAYRLQEGALSTNLSRMARAAVALLEKASDMDLSPEERSVLDRSLAERRRELRVEETREALLEGADDARSRALGVAREPGHALATRLRAGAAAAAPGMARRLLMARERRRSVGVAGIPVPRRRT
jgi:hypothetical protein